MRKDVALPLNCKIYYNEWSDNQFEWLKKECKCHLFAFVAMLLGSFGAPMLTLAYVSGIILLTHHGHFKRLSQWLAAVGRMALTNYLMHSIIASFLFYGYGLGWYGQMPPWLGILPVLVIYGLQIPFSIYWLRRFRFGPFEWLWRSLTYMKWQKF